MRAALAKRRQNVLLSDVHTKPGHLQRRNGPDSPQVILDLDRLQKRKKIENGVLEVAGNLLMSPQNYFIQYNAPHHPQVRCLWRAVSLLGVGGIKLRIHC